MGESAAAHLETTQDQRHQTSVGRQWNHLKTLLLVAALDTTYFAQLLFLIYSAAFVRDIAAAVGGATLTSWPSIVIGIITAVLCPIVAQTADFFGRKWLLVCLTASGFVGALIVSRADSMEMAIAGFSIGAISYGAQPLLHAVVSEVLPRKYRSLAQASLNSSGALGAIIGLVAGGALVRTKPENFRILGYLAAAVYGSSAVGCALLYNPPPRETQLLSLRSKLRSLDWIAYLLLAPGLVLFCLGLSRAQNPYPWSDALVWAPLLVSGLLFLGLAGYEWRLKKDGLFHHRLFQHRNFTITLLAVFLEGVAAFAINVFVPFQLNVFYPTMGAFMVSVCFSVTFMAFLVFSLTAGLSIWKLKSVRTSCIVGFLAWLIFFILAGSASPSTREANFWGYQIFVGAGFGFLLTSIVTAAQFSTPPELIAVTSGLLLATRSVGATIGLAGGNAIFIHGISQNLATKVAAAAIALGLPQSSIRPLIVALSAHDAAALEDVPGISPEIVGAASLALQDAHRIAFGYVWADFTLYI